MHYDYLIVGSGLYGAVCAHELTKQGKKCLVVEKRDHIGGNVYTEEIEGINVHKYGAHIFHTSDKEIWDYVYEHNAPEQCKGCRFIQKSDTMPCIRCSRRIKVKDYYEIR